MKKFALFLILYIPTLWASPGDGGYAGAFLRMGFEARTKALGDAYTAVPEGAVAGIYNPATLPNLTSRQAILSFSFLPLDRTLDYVGFATPLAPKAKNGESGQPLEAGLAVGWIHAGVKNIDGRDGSGNHTEYLSNSENAFFMSFALKPSQYLSIGVSGKILYNRIPGITEDNGALTSSGFGLDIGVYSNPLPGLSIGIALKDNLSKYSWNTDSVYERGTSTTYEFPRIVRAGAAYRIPRQWLLVVADLETSDVQNPRYHIGAEFTAKELGALRIGLDHDTPSFGFGLYLQIFGKLATLNYAFTPGLEALTPEHVVSWMFDF